MTINSIMIPRVLVEEILEYVEDNSDDKFLCLQVLSKDLDPWDKFLERIDANGLFIYCIFSPTKRMINRWGNSIAYMITVLIPKALDYGNTFLVKELLKKYQPEEGELYHIKYSSYWLPLCSMKFVLKHIHVTCRELQILIKKVILYQEMDKLKVLMKLARNGKIEYLRYVQYIIQESAKNGIEPIFTEYLNRYKEKLKSRKQFNEAMLNYTDIPHYLYRTYIEAVEIDEEFVKKKFKQTYVKDRETPNVIYLIKKFNLTLDKIVTYKDGNLARIHNNDEHFYEFVAKSYDLNTITRKILKLVENSNNSNKKYNRIMRYFHLYPDYAEYFIVELLREGKLDIRLSDEIMKYYKSSVVEVLQDKMKLTEFRPPFWSIKHMLVQCNISIYKVTSTEDIIANKWEEFVDLLKPEDRRYYEKVYGDVDGFPESEPVLVVDIQNLNFWFNNSAEGTYTYDVPNVSCRYDAPKEVEVRLKNTTITIKDPIEEMNDNIW